MKKIVLITALLLAGLNATAQVKAGDNPAAINSNSVLELESANKGLLHPRVALTATVNAAPLSAHVQGMVVYNTATVADVTPGIYVNDGTKWLAANRPPLNPTVTAVCNGFTGTYTAGASARTFTVTYTNNSFTSAAFTPVTGDLVLNPASGLTVASVSPNTAQTLASGATLLVTYTLSGTLAATAGTVITGTFTKFGLSYTNSVTVANAAPIVNAGNEQAYDYNTASSFNLLGSATDADGTVVSYAWTKTGGTGTSTPVITNPSSVTTTVTGVNTDGTYIFTLTATDNLGATGTATVTITAGVVATSTVGGPGGTTMTFMSHNLGANYALNHLTPVQAIHGDYYRYGSKNPIATAATSAAIAGWNSYGVANKAWNSGTEAAPVKTAADPCPGGFRIPTSLEYTALINAANGNTVSYVGTFTNSASNYASGMRITHASTVKLLFPSTGYLFENDGSIRNRGFSGYYHTSKEIVSFNSDKMVFNGNAGNPAVTSSAYTEGSSVRCIKM